MSVVVFFFGGLDRYICKFSLWGLGIGVVIVYNHTEKHRRPLAVCSHTFSALFNIFLYSQRF